LPISCWPRPPAPERGHVGLGPGFVDEHQALGIDHRLTGLPSPTSPDHVRPVLLSRERSFFEAEPLGVQEAPHRLLAHRDPQRHQLVPQRLDRPVRHLRNQGVNRLAMWLQQTTTVAAELRWLHAPGHAMPSRPLRDRRGHNPEAFLPSDLAFADARFRSATLGMPTPRQSISRSIAPGTSVRLRTSRPSPNPGRRRPSSSSSATWR
jgi:hypothetical protein